MLRVKMCCSSLTISSASHRSALNLFLAPKMLPITRLLSAKHCWNSFARPEILLLLAFSCPCMRLSCAVLCHWIVPGFCCLHFAHVVPALGSCLACQGLGLQCCTRMYSSFSCILQANSEVSALLGRIPSAVGYQPTLATDLGTLQERITTTKKGSITSVQVTGACPFALHRCR